MEVTFIRADHGRLRAWVTAMIAVIAVLALGNGRTCAAFFTSRSDFLAVVTSPSEINFEGLIGTPEFPINFYGEGHHSTSSAGLDIGGVRFLGFSPGWDTYVVTPNMNSGKWVIDKPIKDDGLIIGRNTTHIYPSPGLKSLGAFIAFERGSSYVGQNRTIVSVHLTNGETHEHTIADMFLDTFFIGWAGSENIEWIELFVGNEWPEPYLIIDDVLISTEPIPEPGSAGLMLALIGMVGARGLGRRIGRITERLPTAVVGQI